MGWVVELQYKFILNEICRFMLKNNVHYLLYFLGDAFLESGIYVLHWLFKLAGFVDVDVNLFFLLRHRRTQGTYFMKPHNNKVLNHIPNTVKSGKRGGQGKSRKITCQEERHLKDIIIKN